MTMLEKTALKETQKKIQKKKKINSHGIINCLLQFLDLWLLYKPSQKV